MRAVEFDAVFMWALLSGAMIFGPLNFVALNFTALNFTALKRSFERLGSDALGGVSEQDSGVTLFYSREPNGPGDCSENCQFTSN